MGKAMRALSDDVDLARVAGVDVDRVVLYVWLIAGSLTTLSGVLLGLLRNIHPNLGWFLLLPIFSAVILGGIGSAYGAMAGGYVIGLAMELSPAFGLPVAYKPAVGFAAMILVLLLRPEGIAGGDTT
jgi:neutral amino acid transport system permease protein